jgi:hypothetical protein
MSLANIVDRRNSYRLAITLIVAVLFLVVVGTPARALANFYSHLDSLNENVQSGDFKAAKSDLDQITGFYETTRAWGLLWAVEDYLFEDLVLQRAAYTYLTGDFEGVLESLGSRADDPRVAYLLGATKFRLAQRRYREVTANDAKAAALKSSIVQEVVERINPDFERAVRGDAADLFAYKWNYDLTSDADAVRRALEAPRGAPPLESEQIKTGGSPVRRRRG